MRSLCFLAMCALLAAVTARATEIDELLERVTADRRVRPLLR